jgi:hypothetical protein
MAKAHRAAPHNTHAAIAQIDLLLNAAIKKNVPTTAHQTGIGSTIKVGLILPRLRSVMQLENRTTLAMNLGAFIAAFVATNQKATSPIVRVW